MALTGRGAVRFSAPLCPCQPCWGRRCGSSSIRAGRPKPGLRPQHLTAVRALARITGAEVEGAELNSRELTFKPRTPKPGNYLFDVAEKTGSAGSVTLIAQALLPPLLKSAGPSTLVLRGGTHVPWSPTAHYLMQVFLPALAQMGAQVSLTLERWGWYPRGGGELRLSVNPCPGFKGVAWRTAPEPAGFQAISAASHLPEHVARRQAARLQERLGPELPVELIAAGGQDPGSLVFIWGPRAGFSALGARGKPAEQVADEAADNCFIFRHAPGGGGPASGRPDRPLPGPGPGAVGPGHFRDYLASPHQPLGHRAVSGAPL